MGEVGRSLPDEQVPRIVEGADLRGHALEAQDAFVHSCIDGVLNVDDIADVTVLSRGDVIESVERLIALELVEWVTPKASSAPPETEVSNDIELDPELQKRIQETFHRADKLNHYELLGVAIDADRAVTAAEQANLERTEQLHGSAVVGDAEGAAGHVGTSAAKRVL